MVFKRSTGKLRIMNSNSVQGFQARLRSPYVFISVQFLLSNYLKEKKKKVKSGSDSKESACTMGNLSWILGSGRSPRERNGYPLKYSFFFFSSILAWRSPWTEESGGL